MKYYGVRNGKEGPQVYTDWKSCENAVKGFSGAKFKAFSSQEEAELFIGEIEDILKSYPLGHHITCDASSSIKENYWEYQLVWTDDKTLIYRSPTYKNGTNNTGEVLGLCHAIKYRNENNLDCNIYTDSMTAISAIEKGSYNMKSQLISEETRNQVLSFLSEISNMNKENIIHYNNKLIGIEIPSDFGRK